MPPARKSPAGARRSRKMLAIFVPATGRAAAESDCLPRRNRCADVAANQPRHFSFPRTLDGLPRLQNVGHLSSCIFATQSRRQGRRLERSAKSDGGTWPRNKKEQGQVSAQRRSAWYGHGGFVGQRRLPGAFRNPHSWQRSSPVRHAVLGRHLCHYSFILRARLGTLI